MARAEASRLEGQVAAARARRLLKGAARMTAPQRSWIAETLFALALLAYPRAFRRRFGAEMRDDFRRPPRAAAGHRLVRNGLAERWAGVVRWSFFPNATPHLYEPSGRHAMFWDTVRADVRFAIRQALQAPLYTGLAVAALALGIGANSAIFTVVQGILLKPLPYQDPGQLVMVWSHNTKEEKPENPISPANFVDLRDESAVVRDLEAYFSFVTNSPLVVDGPPEMVVTSFVEPDLFTLLGRTALLGRTLPTATPPAPGDQPRLLAAPLRRRSRRGRPHAAVRRRARPPSSA